MSTILKLKPSPSLAINAIKKALPKPEGLIIEQKVKNLKICIN